MMRARSSALSTIRWNHFISTVARSLAVLPRQAGQAVLAVAMACSVSDESRLATSASVCPVAGSVTGKREEPLTQMPLMSASVTSSLASLRLARGEVFMSMEAFYNEKLR
jgi:hypothetical protein